MAFDFVESSQELSKRVLIPDTRSPSTRAAEWLADPLNFGRAMLGLGVLALIALPWLALPMAGFMALALLMHGLVQHPLPARYPKDLGGLDPSHAIADRPGGGSPPKPADGIFFLAPT
jgi:intracellular multiplication protein IcmO